MKMTSFIIGLSFFLVTYLAHAATWVQVGSFAGASIQVDIDNLQYTDEKTRVHCETKSSRDGLVAIGKISIDFPRKSYAVGESRLFDASNKLISTSPGQPGVYEPIQPGTLGEDLFRFLYNFRAEPAL